MNNDKFQELVLKKLELLDTMQTNIIKMVEDEDAKRGRRNHHDR